MSVSRISTRTFSRWVMSSTAVYRAVIALTTSWIVGSMTLSRNAAPMCWNTHGALSGIMLKLSATMECVSWRSLDAAAASVCSFCTRTSTFTTFWYMGTRKCRPSSSTRGWTAPKLSTTPRSPAPMMTSGFMMRITMRRTSAMIPDLI